MPSTPTTAKKQAPLGLVLRGIRAAVGMTQQAHADAMGVDPTVLSRLESGERRASHERLVELLAALGVGRQAQIQARLAILHGDGLLTEGELANLMAYHGCRPVICLYKSHPTYGDRLEACEVCGQQMLCRPEGHRCPNGCAESADPSSCGAHAGGPCRHLHGEAEA